jgi:hypothetical protein
MCVTIQPRVERLPVVARQALQAGCEAMQAIVVVFLLQKSKAIDEGIPFVSGEGAQGR